MINTIIKYYSPERRVATSENASTATANEATIATSSRIFSIAERRRHQLGLLRTQRRDGGSENKHYDVCDDDESLIRSAYGALSVRTLLLCYVLIITDAIPQVHTAS